VKLSAVELRRVALPLVTPFRTSYGTETVRDILLLRVETDTGQGWGECCAQSEPLYSSEYVDGCQQVLRGHLVPRLFGAGALDAAGVAEALRPVRGHRMAKSALEMAVLDAELRGRGESFAEHLGAVRTEVDCGVSLGIHDSIPDLLTSVERFIDQGYRRIKLKIVPGWDLEPVRAVRERWPGIPLQVDANAAYTLEDAGRLASLDPFELLLIEQPLAEEQLLAHARLAGMVKTPICLDESIVSADSAADAIAIGACAIVNVKPARVGGYLEARRVHDVCLARGVPVWCGGMLETGLGRAGNLALAALPGFTLPGDTSASDRYYRRDVTPPFELHRGRLQVPSGSGLGVDVDVEFLDSVTTYRETLRR
jgi:O-succinylbenzoate synthase